MLARSKGRSQLTSCTRGRSSAVLGSDASRIAAATAAALRASTPGCSAAAPGCGTGAGAAGAAGAARRRCGGGRQQMRNVSPGRARGGTRASARCRPADQSRELAGAAALGNREHHLRGRLRRRRAGGGRRRRRPTRSGRGTAAGGGTPGGGTRAFATRPSLVDRRSYARSNLLSSFGQAAAAAAARSSPAPARPIGRTRSRARRAARTSSRTTLPTERLSRAGCSVGAPRRGQRRTTGRPTPAEPRRHPAGRPASAWGGFTRASPSFSSRSAGQGATKKGACILSTGAIFPGERRRCGGAPDDGGDGGDETCRAHPLPRAAGALGFGYFPSYGGWTDSAYGGFWR